MSLHKINEMNKHLKGTIWQNIKTEGFYLIQELCCDSTNEREGNTIVIYKSMTNDSLPAFARDMKEFSQKFKKIG